MRKYFSRIPSAAWVCSSINFLAEFNKREMVGEGGILCAIRADLTEAPQEGSGLVSCQPKPPTPRPPWVLQLTKPLCLRSYACVSLPAILHGPGRGWAY